MEAIASRFEAIPTSGKKGLYCTFLPSPLLAVCHVDSGSGRHSIGRLRSKPSPRLRCFAWWRLTGQEEAKAPSASVGEFSILSNLEESKFVAPFVRTGSQLCSVDRNWPFLGSVRMGRSTEIHLYSCWNKVTKVYQGHWMSFGHLASYLALWL